MADKPYQERTGGSYVRNKETGKLVRAEDVRPPAAAADQKPATEKKGK